jgi:hypothetical protein
MELECCLIDLLARIQPNQQTVNQLYTDQPPNQASIHLQPATAPPSQPTPN